MDQIPCWELLSGAQNFSEYMALTGELWRFFL